MLTRVILYRGMEIGRISSDVATESIPTTSSAMASTPYSSLVCPLVVGHGLPSGRQQEAHGLMVAKLTLLKTQMVMVLIFRPFTRAQIAMSIKNSTITSKGTLSWQACAFWKHMLIQKPRAYELHRSTGMRECL